MTPCLGRVWLVTGALLCAAAAVAQVQVLPGASGQGVGQVYIEDSPAAQDLAAEAFELQAQGRFAEAAQKLQRVSEVYPHKLMPTGGSSYTDAVLWVRGRLLEDAQLLEAYRSLFGPEAERETDRAMPTADRGIDADALRGVLSRYTLTRAGLDAGLALGVYHLERAEGGDASGVLDELVDHPDLLSEAGRYHLMRGVASLLNGDTAGYETERRALRDLSDVPRLAELDALTNRIHPPLRLHQKPQDNTVKPGLPESLEKPLWDVDLLDTLWQGLGQRVDVRAMSPDQAALRVLPASSSDKVFINLGVKLKAYDRASGWHLWEAPDQSDSPPNPNFMVLNPGMVTEPRGVYLNGGRAFTLLGWMPPNQNIRLALEVGVALVGIDTDDGAEVWRVTPGELDPTFENAAFDGTPSGGGGRIYTFVKRVRVSGLHDLYLTAVRQVDGALVWRRHLSSSSSESNYNTGPSGRMILHAGRVYASDNRGTVIALDGLTGTVRWATILPGAGVVDPSARRSARSVRDVPKPVLVDAGLLVPPIKSGGPYHLLDPVSGALLRELRNRGWREVEACYAAGADVLAVGQGVSVFDGPTLDLTWRRPLDAGLDGRVRGRPAIDPQMTAGPAPDAPDGDTSDGVVVFSTDRRLIALDLGDGRVLTDTPATMPGNVLLTSGQVLVASAADLHAYTDWRVAHGQLKNQVDLDPSNPRPGMALAGLAIRTGRDAAVLEGIDLALGSLEVVTSDAEVADVRQRDVFGLLRELVDPAGGVGMVLRGQLLDRMAASTAGPGQEATYQLTRGLYLQEQGEPGRAAEHYQAVLSDRMLSAELYAVGRGSRRAGLEAKRLLKALIKTHGREVYQSYDLLAEHELGELFARGEPEARHFADLADRYPLALCVNEARQYAADRYLEAADQASAMRQLQAVYLDGVTEDVLAQVAGRIVGVYVLQDRPELAARWLRRVEREHPGLILLRGDQPVHVQSWLSELRQLLSASRRLPGFELPLEEPVWLDGWPMPVDTAVTGETQPSDRVVMTDGVSVWMLSAPDLVELWRVPLPVKDACVVAMDDRQVIWWSEESRRLGTLSSRNGESLWPEIDVKASLVQAGDPRVRSERRTRSQQQFVQILGGAAVRNPRLNANMSGGDAVMTAVDLTTIMIADHLGRAVCIDRDTGQVRWSTLGPSDSLTSIALGDGLVALGGASWADTAAQHGIVTLLDTLTGEPLETVIQSEKVPYWLGFADNGLLVTAMPGVLTGYDAVTGRTEWRSEVQQAAGINRFQLGGRLLVVSMPRGQVGAAQVIDTDSGEVVNQLPLRSAKDRPMLFDAVQAEGQWHTLTPMGAVALRASGQTHWSDAICAPVGHIVLQRVGRRYVCVVGGTSPTPTPDLDKVNLDARPDLKRILLEQVEAVQQRDEAQGYRLYLLDRATGSIVSELPLREAKAPITPDACALIDGALLLGVDGRTLVVRGQNPAD
jgi:outer membrane protein assembly factor BamB